MGLRLQSDESKYSPEDFAALFPNQDEVRNQKFYDDDVAPELASLLEPSLISVLLPHVQSFRTAARLLHFDTQYAVEQGDTQRVTENLSAFYGLAKHAADCNCIVGGLVGFAVADMGFRELQETLQSHPTFLSSQQLQRIQNTLEKFRPRDLIQLGGEQALVHDLIQRVFTDDGNGDGRITPVGLRLLNEAVGGRQEKWSKEFPEFETAVDIAQSLSQPAAVFTSASRRETLERYDAIMQLLEEDLERPAWEAKMHNFYSELGWHRNTLDKYTALTQLIPANEQLQNKLYYTIGTQEAAILALAMQRFNLTNHSWPSSLQELTPEFLMELPVDVFNGQPLNFKIIDNTPVVYGVWHDGDDDDMSKPTISYTGSNGKYREREDSHFIYFRYDKVKTWKYDGDYILWPVSKKPY